MVPKILNADELAAIRAREAAASPGPWHVFRKWRLEVETADGGQVADIGYIGDDDGAPDDEMRAWMEADAAFIAHAREDIPHLLAALDAAQDTRDREVTFWQGAVQQSSRNVTTFATQGFAMRNRLIRQLLDIALWANECVPDTLYEHFGDVSGDIAAAEELLREEAQS